MSALGVAVANPASAGIFVSCSFGEYCMTEMVADNKSEEDFAVLFLAQIPPAPASEGVGNMARFGGAKLHDPRFECGERCNAGVTKPYFVRW